MAFERPIHELESQLAELEELSKTTKLDIGDEVEAGQGVVVLEAMKMENQINADKAGTITDVKVAPGDTVGGGDIVVVID